MSKKLQFLMLFILIVSANFMFVDRGQLEGRENDSTADVYSDSEERIEQGEQEGHHWRMGRGLARFQERMAEKGEGKKEIVEKKKSYTKDKDKKKDKKLAKKKKKKLKRKKRRYSKYKRQDKKEKSEEEVQPIVSGYANHGLPPNILPLENSPDPLASNGSGGSPRETVFPDETKLIAKTWKNGEYFRMTKDEVQLYLEVEKEDNTIPVEATAQIYNSDHEMIKEISYQETTKSNQYMASFRPEGDDFSRKLGKFYVKIKATESEDSENRKSIHLLEAFALNYEMATFRNRFRSKISKAKHLDFSAMYNIYQSGRYLLEATLYDNQGQLVGYTENIVTLKRGRHWVPFQFYGQLFHLKKASGPYHLKCISLSYINDNLSTVDAKVYQTSYKTKTYRYDDFSSTPYDDIVVSK
jgi:hypothetical protein